MPHVHPDDDALSALGKLPDEGPVVMLNLLRFREQAAYPADAEHTPCSGREAYRRYGALAIAHVQKVGARAIFMGAPELVVIGPADAHWDEVLLVQYPSRAAFMQMAQDPAYLACTVHRTAALADSRLVAMRPAASKG